MELSDLPPEKKKALWARLSASLRITLRVCGASARMTLHLKTIPIFLSSSSPSRRNYLNRRAAWANALDGRDRIMSELYGTRSQSKRKNMNEEMAPWVVVEGPAPGSAEFLRRWQLAVAAADRELHDRSPARIRV